MVDSVKLEQMETNMAEVVVGGDLAGLSKRPSARPSMKQVASMKRVASTKPVVEVEVDQVKLGYSSKSEKKRLDLN
jgi:hypothetical protein